MSPRVPRARGGDTQVLTGFFDRHHVEAGNDLGYAAQVEEIPSGRVVLLRSPLLISPAERAKVPGCCEEIAIEMPGRDRLVKRRDESLKDLIRSCGSGSVISRVL